jgi:pyruvate,orthophosphate dikinase
MQDIEFTLEEGTLYLLQTRSGKRTAAAALRIAVDMVAEGLVTQEEAVARVDPGQLDQLLHPMIDPDAEYEVVARGLNASPGAATGRSSSTPTAHKSKGAPGMRSSSSGPRRRPTTSTASSRRVASSPRTAA